MHIQDETSTKYLKTIQKPGRDGSTRTKDFWLPLEKHGELG